VVHGALEAQVSTMSAVQEASELEVALEAKQPVRRLGSAGRNNKMHSSTLLCALARVIMHSVIVDLCVYCKKRRVQYTSTIHLVHST